MNSSRIPGKVLMPAARRPLLAILLERLQRARAVDAIVVATTAGVIDDQIVAVAQAGRVEAFRGSEDDVLGRVCGALDAARADV